MGKEKLLKLFRRKSYWEKEKDKCLDKMAGALYWLFFFAIFFFADSLDERIEKIKEVGWGFEGIVRLIVLIGFLVITFAYLFVTLFLQIRIQQCSGKLVKINQQILAELENCPTEAEQKKL